MAPSSFNRQPWRFLLKGNRAYLAIKRDERVNDELDLLDAGIIMLYVELLFAETNISGTWKLSISEKPVEVEDIPEEYKYIGYFSPEQ